LASLKTFYPKLIKKKSEQKLSLPRKLLGLNVWSEKTGNNDTFYTTQKGCDDGTLNFEKVLFASSRDKAFA
jgi:hypothetical protein